MSTEMKATFLTDTQLWGGARGKGQLQVMKAYGTETGMSDLAIVLGGSMGQDKTSDGQRAGREFWSAASKNGDNIRAVNFFGVEFCNYPNLRNYGARPALPSSVTSKIRLTNDSSAEALPRGEARLTRSITGLHGERIQVVECGEYPQMIAPENIGNELEQAFSRKQLRGTGKNYTFDAEKYNAYNKPFKAKKHAEYKYKTRLSTF